MCSSFAIGIWLVFVL
jgi:hypothetical protein